MKIAYCFTGHSRTYKKCYQSFFDNIFSVAPGDIFIHTWDVVSSDTPAYWNKFKPLTTDQIWIANEKIEEDEIRKIYNPVSIVLGFSNPVLPVPGKTGEHQYCHGLKQYYEGVQWAVHLANKHSTYDRVFILRMDIEFLSKLDPKELEILNVVNAKHSYLEGRGSHTDLFLHGSQKDITTSADYYWNMDELFFRNPNNQYHEDAWSHYMRNKGVTITPSSLKFRIQRVFDMEPTYFP